MVIKTKTVLEKEVKELKSKNENLEKDIVKLKKSHSGKLNTLVRKHLLTILISTIFWFIVLYVEYLSLK